MVYEIKITDFMSNSQAPDMLYKKTALFENGLKYVTSSIVLSGYLFYLHVV